MASIVPFVSIQFGINEARNPNPGRDYYGRMDISNIPKLGLGTATLKDERCINAIKSAVNLGYRMFDTALLYGNQVDILL
jgi:hypothetical protein